MNCTDEALSTRLDALSCPFKPHPDLSDPLQAQKLIAWLEDTHIRRLPVDERKPLYSTGSFLGALRTYLGSSLSAPKTVIPSTVAQIRVAAVWLIDLALHLHYMDDAALYNDPIDPWHGLCVPTVENSVIDLNVQQAASRLAQTLGVPLPRLLHNQQTKTDDLLCVAADIVEHVVKIPNGLDLKIPHVDDIPLGFSTKDPVVDRAAKISRALHVRQLRQVQDDINHVIADMQALTANPKTNSKLGKVGR